ncbi:hypothetical protein EYR38_004791 [Pleurotus pulmonarius]|nr:hypothetical protein EYR38_004791 [Pleurotus pulmonarius]
MLIDYQRIATKFTDQGIHVFEKGTTGYNDGIRHVLQNSSRASAFAIHPLNVDQLAKTIKGCGSSWNPGSSSTDGVQIYMTFFDKIDFSDQSYIDVGAGCLWAQVYAAMENSGKNIAGGISGVASVLLGGAYSLGKFNQYGLTIDHILEMEIVIPSGKVMVVKEDGEGSDLFEALKGGGNNFGVVTRFRLKTHDQGPIWGGTFVFGNECETEVTNAINDYIREEMRREETHREPPRREAELFATFRSFIEKGELKHDIRATCVYDGPKPERNPWASFVSISEKATVLKESKQSNGFSYNVNRLSDVNSYSVINSLISEIFPTSPHHDMRGRLCCIMVNGYTKTLINAIAREAKVFGHVLPGGSALMFSIKAASQEMKKRGGKLASFPFFPCVTSIFDDSKPAAWPHSRDRVIVPLMAYFLWEGEENDEFWSATMQHALNNIKEVARREGCIYENSPEYPPLAVETSNAEEVYRENLDKLVAIRKKYDPENVMGLTGGFKIPLSIKKPAVVKKTNGTKKGEHGRQLLRLYDTIVVVDDSSSMCEEDRWAHAQQAVEGIAAVAAQYDSDGIDLHFINSTQVGTRLTRTEHVMDLCCQAELVGNTQIGAKLGALLWEYIAKISIARKQAPSSRYSIKRMNLIVITDGDTTDGDSDFNVLASVITGAAKRLKSDGWPPNQVGISFVQVGNADDAEKYLRHLDDDLSKQNEIPDMVDTTRYHPDHIDEALLSKMLLGGSKVAASLCQKLSGLDESVSDRVDGWSQDVGCEDFWGGNRGIRHDEWQPRHLKWGSSGMERHRVLQKALKHHKKPLLSARTTGYNDSIRHLLRSSTQHAAFAVQPLNVQQLVDTIKGGGCSRNPGFSSTKGVQIYMTFFDKIDISGKDRYIDVGAGCLWERVYAAMENTGKNVVGGLGGVAGFLLGSGYSLKSNRYGLGVDNVLEMEVVLPDGKIMTVRDDSEGSDLFEALKGGGNNFGIVTRFRLKTHDQGPFWGGLFVFGSRYERDITNAVDTFIREEMRREETYREPSSREASLVAAFRSSVDDGELKHNVSVLCVYDGQKPDRNPWASFASISEREGALKASKQNGRVSYDINRLSEINSYTVVDALTSECFPVPHSPNMRGRVCSVMVNGYTKTLIDAIASESKIMARDMKEHGGKSASLLVFPGVTSMFDNSKPAAWPHARDHPLVPLVAYFLWEGQHNDEFWSARLKETLDNVKEAARREGCTYKDTPAYPVMAFETTSAEEIYRENLEKLIAIRKKYDPNNVMGLTGGFKIPLSIQKPAPFKKANGTKKGEHSRQLLKLYDTVVIVDDSSSMCEEDRWAHAQQAVEGIAGVAAQYDSDGIDLHFINSTQVGTGLKRTEDVMDVCCQAELIGKTQIGAKLGVLLSEYIAKITAARKQAPSSRYSIKRMNLVVITDGDTSDGDSDFDVLASVITGAARRLRSDGWPPSQVGISFVQVGNADDAEKYLQHLDDDLSKQNEIPDMVDTTRYHPEHIDEALLSKMLLGGISRVYDHDLQ